MAGGQALVHARATHFLVPPHKLLIVGLDTEHVAGEHPLWRADVKSTPDAAFVASVRKHGIIQPIRARKTSKDDNDMPEVVVGRERTKAARIIEAEGTSILVPCLLWSMGTPDAEIIGVANAENFQRKVESAVLQAEHVHMQLRALGFYDGAEEIDCLKNVSVSTGMSVQRLRNLLAFRGDGRLVAAVTAGQVGAEAALALATLEPEDRAAQLEVIMADPSTGTVVEVRERVAYIKAAAKASVKASRKVHNGFTPSADNDADLALDRDADLDAEDSHLDESDTEEDTDDADTEDESTGEDTNEFSADDKPRKKAKKKKSSEPALGMSKSLMKRIVTKQMSVGAESRTIDVLVLKTLRAAAGLAAPSTVPGLAKALRDLGL